MENLVKISQQIIRYEINVNQGILKKILHALKVLPSTVIMYVNNLRKSLSNS